MPATCAGFCLQAITKGLVKIKRSWYDSTNVFVGHLKRSRTVSLEQAIAENTAVLRELVALVKANPGAVVQPVLNVKVEKTTTKKDNAAVTKTETKAPEQTAPAADETKADAPTGVEYKQIQQLVPQIAKTPEGTAKVVALFGRYGVKRGPELKQEQYDDFYADLLKVQAGELDPREAEVA